MMARRQLQAENCGTGSWRRCRTAVILRGPGISVRLGIVKACCYASLVAFGIAVPGGIAARPNRIKERTREQQGPQSLSLESGTSRSQGTSPSLRREAVTRFRDQFLRAFRRQPVPECTCSLVSGSSGEKGCMLWNAGNQVPKIEHFRRVKKRNL